ncbi:hypothetical protein EYF80_063458 [Liparis tanakae]|uniref:Uncharacterized protein n=1 Tax=Liparis tanakae TaxID=230148 RepID=A0A4Z2EC32_9TELE|nr:hypothetical protein EYF80_063458 [Liparis tanakae]
MKDMAEDVDNANAPQVRCCPDDEVQTCEPHGSSGTDPAPAGTSPVSRVGATPGAIATAALRRATSTCPTDLTSNTTSLREPCRQLQNSQIVQPLASQQPQGHQPTASSWPLSPQRPAASIASATPSA